MFNPLRIFAPPQDAVHSLQVQARMGPLTGEEEGQFRLLLRHFLNSFFNNEMVASDGEAKAHLLQVGYAIALPGLIVALYLFVPYHSPIVRAYWARVSDRYFYVLYSMSAVGAVTVFEWDLLFPGIADIFVLSSLPIESRRLFLARVSAIGIFLGTVVIGLNLLGVIFFPASCDLPSLTRHFAAHFLAVTGGGLFMAAFVVGSQGMLLAALGQRLFQRISPLLQGAYIAVLLTALFLFPVVSRFLGPLLMSHREAVRSFPPFWFLGVYERVLDGPAASGVFSGYAVTGVFATIGAVALAVTAYPLAYLRHTRYLIEGRAVRNTTSWFEKPIGVLLHATIIRTPAARAIYHFIGQTLLRTHRHRVYLAMYGGAGLALVVSSAVLLHIKAGHVTFSLSAEGLRAAVPIVTFWTIAGLRNTFVSPANREGGWIFRAIWGRPGVAQLMAGRRWALAWSLATALTVVTAIHLIGPPEMHSWRSTAMQALVAVSMCLLLRDIFFLRDTMVPFTGVQAGSKTNLAFTLIQYFGLFPPLVLVTLSVESWMQNSALREAVVVLAVIAIHGASDFAYRQTVARNVRLMDVDDEDEEFPQRLGLRY